MEPSAPDTTPAAALAAEAVPVWRNPLDVDGHVEKVEVAVNRMVDAVVGHVEDEIERAVRRREVAGACRRILDARDTLAAIDGDLPGLLRFTTDGVRADLVKAFKTLNPTAADETVAAAVDGFLQPYREKTDPQPDAPARPPRGRKAAAAAG